MSTTPHQFRVSWEILKSKCRGSALRACICLGGHFTRRLFQFTNESVDIWCIFLKNDPFSSFLNKYCMSDQLLRYIIYYGYFLVTWKRGYIRAWKFASEAWWFASEALTFASEAWKFASEAWCFASEVWWLASEAWKFASEDVANN